VELWLVSIIYGFLILVDAKTTDIEFSGFPTIPTMILYQKFSTIYDFPFQFGFLFPI
jgi:hypothetical protein